MLKHFNEENFDFEVLLTNNKVESNVPKSSRENNKEESNIPGGLEQNNKEESNIPGGLEQNNKEESNIPERLEENNKDAYAKNIDKFVFVDFFATWCGPCQMLSPVIEELANDEELDGKVDIGKVDIDESRNIAERFGIMSVPTMILFKNGAEIRRISGFKPKELLKTEIIKAINVKNS